MRLPYRLGGPANPNPNHRPPLDSASALGVKASGMAAPIGPHVAAPTWVQPSGVAHRPLQYIVEPFRCSGPF